MYNLPHRCTDYSWGPGSVSPAIRACSIARPIVPMMSDMAASSLMFAPVSSDVADVAASLANKLLTRAQQIAQNLGLGIRHEAAPDQTMGNKICQPSGIVDLGLAARNVLDVFGVRQHQRKIAITQDVPDRLPIDARRLHGHLSAALGCQPVRQNEKACGGGGVERADFPFRRTPHHRPLVTLIAGRLAEGAGWHVQLRPLRCCSVRLR